MTLDADVARVFGSSEVVNAALRQLIALAQLMGPQALSQAAKEEVVEPMATEDKNETVLINDESAATEVVSENSQTDEEEEWFEIPVEAK